MDRGIYGYLLDEKILFDIAKKKIIHYSCDDGDGPIFFQVVSLNETQTRLLRFLLNNRNKDVICRTDIMKEVWDEFSLSSSSQRLWQSMNDLRKKLSSAGLPDDFITNIYGHGYSVDQSKILSLFVN
ncbi:winged helix-turn-helix domain-containing protein [Enterobacter hormaechei]